MKMGTFGQSATRFQTIIAHLEFIICELFRIGRSGSRSGSEGAAYNWNFWSGWGVKFVIIDNEGRVRALGNSFWTIHRYDEMGNLLSRKRMIHTVKPDEKIVFGHRSTYDIYDKHRHI